MAARRGLCWVGLHRWKVVRKPGVAPYTACARCEREQMLDPRPDRLGGAAAGGMFGGGDRR
ncbi:hypothetical protein [Aquipuribacter sp. SD81]|uniref:hypothetical protein n=1 Tax=Aquipuribacter sp. SD81 TaxID=3127703 RepID=UPI0030187D18